MKKSSIGAILIWFLYGAAAGSGLFLTAMSVSAALGYSALLGLVAGIVLLLLVGAAVWGLHRVLGRFRPWIDDERVKLICVIVEGLLVTACLAGMTAIRLTSPWDVEGDPVFAQAQVTSEGLDNTVAHGGMYFYLRLLHGVMLLVGNKAGAAIFLQIILLICAAFGLYLGIRRLSGVLPALMALGFLGFGPYMIGESHRLTPLLLFLTVFGAAVGCIAALPRKIGSVRQDSDKRYAILYCAAVGILIGFCCYLDMAGIALLVILTGVICFTGEDDEPREYNAVTVFGGCLGASVFGYVLSHGFFRIGGGSLISSIGSQLALYQPGRFQIPVTVSLGGTGWDIPVLFLGMTAGVFGFWCCQEIRDKAFWLFASLLLFVMYCFGMGGMTYLNGYALLYLLCAAMAGCSVDDLWSAGSTDADDMPEDWESAEADESEMVFVDVEEQQPYRETGVNYIENPLPLPKKREHKAMDYDYEVADDDDFDIQ